MPRRCCLLPFLALVFSAQWRINGRNAKSDSMASTSSPESFHKKLHYSIIDLDIDEQQKLRIGNLTPQATKPTLPVLCETFLAIKVFVIF